MTEFQEMYLHDQEEPDGLFFQDTGRQRASAESCFGGRQYIYINR